MNNTINVAGRTYVITGASSGIGRASAVLLSRLGATLVLVARSRDKLQETAEELDGQGHRIIAADLRDHVDIDRWMRATAKEVGLFSGLVHSAGVEVTRPLQFQDASTLDQVMSLNFTAGVFLAKAFRKRGVCAENGSLVYLSSIAGLIGLPGRVAYCSSKAALGGFVRASAVELAAEGIRINCVAPGWVEETEISNGAGRQYTEEQIAAIRSRHPLGTCKPLDVAHAIAFLLADTGRCITGTTLVVDGGYTAQ